MNITLKAQEVKGIIEDQRSLLINANTVLQKAKALIVEQIKPVKVDILFENNDYINETVTLYIICEVGKEGWITPEMIRQPEHKEI